LNIEPLMLQFLDHGWLKKSYLGTWKGFWLFKIWNFLYIEPHILFISWTLGGYIKKLPLEGSQVLTLFEYWKKYYSQKKFIISFTTNCRRLCGLGVGKLDYWSGVKGFFCFRPDSTCWGPLREKFIGYFSWKRFPLRFQQYSKCWGLTFPKKQTFWKVLHHRVVKIYFCELSREHRLWAVGSHSSNRLLSCE